MGGGLYRMAAMSVTRNMTTKTRTGRARSRLRRSKAASPKHAGHERGCGDIRAP
jgi:hypothetical protein